MSLCLSKQTHFGFEVDLLYFFCGCLTLQLMKIKLILVIVGVSFSYSLIILRFYLSDAIEGGNLGLQTEDQHSLVIQVDADLEESNTAAENTQLINVQPQEVIYSEIPPIMNSNAFQENARLILPQEAVDSESDPIMIFSTSQENTNLSMPQEAIDSESAPIMNFDAPQENTHLITTQEVIHSESVPIMNFDAPQENEEFTQVNSRLQHNIAPLNKEHSITRKVKEKERGGITSMLKKIPFGAKQMRALRKSMMHTSKSLSAHD
ncbi:exocyst complex component EXO70B1 [Trifolium repens]|nr:exocyst complex component EXO70B1 [Trifolium repens]